MNAQPAYFERVREKAAARWDQLERDPELAAPWHQLFKQVQSPRHILSELLQNADDAGASEARVFFVGDDFIFEHNGVDFSEEHFASLCRFGYSNKRALHTIGFRGIGFKSTFSLGDWVELQTPSLRVRFHKGRFTEPHWVPEPVPTSGATRIRVTMGDANRKREVEKNLEEWLSSPISLLFFQNIRRLRVGERELYWGSMGEGPVPDSEWMALHDKPDELFLIVRSEGECFPSEALAEIQQERMFSNEEGVEFPPCRVELVLGAPGRLYVVLPTGVRTALPFACNAPFIQDPARLKIKDPETSVTNQWLLERTGKLAVRAMLAWLGSEGSVQERAQAYGLMPDVDRNDNSLEGVCAAAVEEAFAEAVGESKLLLTEEGTLVEAKRAVALPAPILDVWPDGQAAALFDDIKRPVFSRDVADGDRQKLLNWGLLDIVDRAGVLARLECSHLPAPKAWRQLLTLWTYIAPALTDYRAASLTPKLRIMPVQGRDVLCSARETVRLGERRLLQSDSDWDFLSRHLVVLNQNWARYLTEQRRLTSDATARAPNEAETAIALLGKAGLSETSEIDSVMTRVAEQFFEQDSITLDDCIRLAQIAARLGASANATLRFVTADEKIRLTNSPVLFDQDGRLWDLLPPDRRDALLLHADYVSEFTSCSKEEWLRWISSGGSGLHSFLPLTKKSNYLYSEAKIETEARRRGVRDTLSYPYVTSNFVVEDWDFDEASWQHWSVLAKQDANVWADIVERILNQRDVYWQTAKSARLAQVATTGTTRTLTNEAVLPSWLLRLRDLPCLRDTRGFVRVPSEMLRRTPETEALLDVEPFVHGLVDRESTRVLLDLLGVRSTPTGPDRVLERLLALSKADKPPVLEVEKWYRRLDQMLMFAPPEDAARVREAFRTERVIYTQDGSWTNAAGVFIWADEEDAPGAAVIRSDVQDLSLWRRVGLAERPNADLAIAWLSSLPKGQVLPPDDLRRVRALLPRHAMRIWEECKCWLNLANEWARIEGLSYALTLQSLLRWQHLHPWVKQRTADFQKLPGEISGQAPFASLALLAHLIEERPDTSLLGRACASDWLNALGSDLARIRLDSDEEGLRVRGLGERLAQTRIVETPTVEVTPYMEGTPAGTSRMVDVAWFDTRLCVANLTTAKAAKRVPEEIGRVFGRDDVKAALNYAFERAASDIHDYMAQNFDLAPEEQVRPIEENASHGAREAPAGQAERQEASIDAVTAPTEPTPRDEDQLADCAEAPESAPEATPRPQKVREVTPQRPPLIDRFARQKGFRKDGDGRFFSEDGRWLARSHDGPFTWTEFSPRGDATCFYWVKEHCLDKAPLQVDAVIWGLVERLPQSHAFVLVSPEEAPIELSGASLLAMREAEALTLFPATYRLVKNDDR